MSGLATPVVAQESDFDKLVNLSFAEARPTTETAQMLREGLLFQCATQIYLWAAEWVRPLNLLRCGRSKATRV